MTQTELIADYNFEFDKLPNSWDEILTGTATSTWNNNSYVDMIVNTQNDRVVRQSRQYFSTRTKKLRRCIFNCILNTENITNCTSRVGVFDDHNDKTANNDGGGAGLFFEYTDRVLYVGIRYGTVDNGTDVLVAQSNFNSNDLSRNSHISVGNWDQLYTFEILFNNIGTIEWSIYLDGERILLHKEIDISRTLNTLPRYNLPLRLEIIKNGANLNSTSLRHFSSSIYYETGSSVLDNKLANISKMQHLSQVSSIEFSITNTSYIPLFSFRLNSLNIRRPILFYEILFMSDSGGPFMYSIIRNPTFNGSQPNWQNASTSIQYDTNVNSINNNNLDIIYQEYIYTSSSGITIPKSVLSSKNKIYYPPLSANIAGTSDIYTIIVKKLGTKNISSYCMLRWITG